VQYHQRLEHTRCAAEITPQLCVPMNSKKRANDSSPKSLDDTLVKKPKSSNTSSSVSESTVAKLPTPNNTRQPRVVRLCKKNGEIVQSCDVYIGRQCYMGGWKLPKSKWANPFSIKDCNGSAKIAVEKYRKYIQEQPTLMAALGELEGKVLGCWCKPQPCHGDVLVSLVQDRISASE
jgi:hypothetical protein